ncbi:MAG TPA: sulfatase-like hydrolase/transferase [Thermoanaerobaculia bacterium]|nr:sulfatase-like hydrolase/transferase [Thermoanaerobaculia bacterium]
MRRTRLPWLLAIALAGLAAAAAWLLLGGRPPRSPAAGTTRTAPAAEGPSLAGCDVLLVTIDTLRGDAVGFAGNRRAATPVLDRLAAAGRVYEDAHAHNVVTLPSHANILTGLYPFQHGIRDNSGFVLPASVPTLGTLLRKAGYATGAFVAAYPLDSQFGLGRGFDVYDDSFPRGSNPDEFVLAERRGDQVVAPALAWWNGHRGVRRFLWVHLYDPHAPYLPPEPFASRFRDNPYLGEVAASDSFLAPLLAPLLDGKEPPALAVVTADHGEALGDHGELTHGLFAYEATLKVPLVVWGPGVPRGRDRRPARHVDIVPTVLQALRLPVPAGLPGRSLLAPPAAAAPSYFEALSTCLNRGWAPLRGMLRERRKLVDLPLPELYDLSDDPREERNLAGTRRRTARELAAALPAESVWPPRRAAVPAEQAAALRSLGYASGSAAPKSAWSAADDPKTLLPLDTKMHAVVDLYSRKRYAEAARLAREVVAARPAMGEAYEHLALALRRLERRGEAIAVLESAVRRGLRGESLVRQLGLALSEAGRAPEAVAILAPLAVGPGADPSTLNALGLALADAGRMAEAVAVLQKLVAAYPQDPRGHENLGIVALRMERPAEARQHLEQALRLNPRLPNSWNTLGVALFRLEQPGAALDAWERAVAIDPAQYDALYNIGLVAAAAGKSNQARQALSRFVASAPPARFAAEIAKARRQLARLGA